MELFRYLMAAVMTLYEMPMTVFGITFSLWQAFVFCFVMYIIILVLSEVFYGE